MLDSPDHLPIFEDQLLDGLQAWIDRLFEGSTYRSGTHCTGTEEFEQLNYIFSTHKLSSSSKSIIIHLKLSSVREDNLDLLYSTQSDVLCVQVPRELLARVPHQPLHLEHQVVAARLQDSIDYCQPLQHPCRRTWEDFWLPCSDMIQFFSPLISYRHLPCVLTM